MTNGRRYQGMEHWLPLFHEQLETLFDHAGNGAVSLDHAADEAIAARLEQIAEFYDARREALDPRHFRRGALQAAQPDTLYLTTR